MKYLVVTNNPLVAETYPGPGLLFVEGTVPVLFKRVRDLVHRGHRLLTHPLSGSLKPGRIPYKTVFMTAERAALDLDSLRLIENSIAACRKTAPGLAAGREARYLAGYAAVDLSHVEAALESLRNEP